MTAPSTNVLLEACVALASRDPALAKAYDAIGLPTWRTRAANYETLARIVVYQLISTKAADAIWARISARYDNVTEFAVRGDDQEALRKCGLSRPKLSHLNSIAEAVQDGVLDFPAMAQAPIDQARSALLSVKGIGPWTADTFLMNAIGHLDAFPSGDVGLIEAYRQLSSADDRLSARAFTEQAEAWRPWRGVGAHLLYDWYNANRK